MFSHVVVDNPYLMFPCGTQQPILTRLLAGSWLHSAVLHRDIRAAQVIASSGELRHVFILALGTQPASRTGTVARGGVTRAAVVALTLLLASRTVLPRWTRQCAVKSSEARRTEALAGVLTALVLSTLTPLATSSAELTWGTWLGAGGTHEARGAVALSRAWITSSAVETLTHLLAVDPVQTRRALQLTVAAVAPRATLTAAGEPVTGHVGVTGTVEAAVRPVATWWALQLTVAPHPPHPALALPRGWVADAVILAAAREGTVRPPRSLGTDRLAALSCVPRGTATLPGPATDAAMLALTRLVALRRARVGEAHEFTGGAIVALETLALSRLRVTHAAVAALTLLFAPDSVVSRRAGSPAVASPVAGGAVAGAVDGITQVTLRTLALLLAPLTPETLLAV